MGMELISAREAFDKGLKRYFTGVPCKFGHIVERMICNGVCVECLRIRRHKTREKNYEVVKQWRKDNPEKWAEQCKRYQSKHKDKLDVYRKEWREKNIEHVRKRDREQRKRLRTLNPEAEKARLKRFSERQEQKRIQEAGRNKPELCEICSTNEFKIVFDHCHNSGKFRGWICDRCNRVLGIVKDSPQLLKELALYLEQHNVKA